jgi:hypothetical protein
VPAVARFVLTFLGAALACALVNFLLQLRDASMPGGYVVGSLAFGLVLALWTATPSLRRSFFVVAAPILALATVDVILRGILGWSGPGSLQAGLVFAFVVCASAGYVVRIWLGGPFWLPLAVAAAFTIGLPVAVLDLREAKWWLVGALVVIATGCLVRQVLWPRVGSWAVVLGAGVILSAAAAHALRHPAEVRFPHRKAFPRTVDLVIVEPKWSLFQSPQLPPRFAPPDLVHWDVQYSVYIRSRPSMLRSGLQEILHRSRSRSEAAATLTDQRPRSSDELLGWLPRRNRVVVLNVDGIPPFALLAQPTASRPGDWEQALGRLRFPGVPFVAVLAGGDRGRLREWKAWTQATGGDAFDFSSLQRVGFVDAAVRVATQTSHTFRDAYLAWRFRPRLRFDLGEGYAYPVDVDKFLESPAVKLCRRGLVAEDCDPMSRERPLSEAIDWLDVSAARPRSGSGVVGTADASVYYFHVRRRPPEIFIDYWWYFPYNPTPVARGLLCAPGFSIREITCFDHDSDWEGVTLVVRQAGLEPEAVRYAQHEGEVTYSWPLLKRLWRNRRVVQRPIVYVAQGSHASYPYPCRRHCLQGARFLFEGDRDGSRSWPNNAESTCGGVCLQELPVTRGGHAALWNAFAGAWGRSHCMLADTICDVGFAPRAPSYQDRYRIPWRPAKSGDGTLAAVVRGLEG